MTQAVVTLVEGDFLKGAAVLYNSLRANGFEGRFVIGYRSASALPQRLLARLRPNMEEHNWMQRNELDPRLHITPNSPGVFQPRSPWIPGRS